MIIKTRRSSPASIAKTRWLVYATAGAATALAGSQSVEASIHYSGRLDVPFPPHENTTNTFRLDQAGDSLVFEHFARSLSGVNAAFLVIDGILSAHPMGKTSSSSFTVYKLSAGQNISSQNSMNYSFGYLAKGPFGGYWLDHGTGYVGFSFNNGAGKQYGWVRVKMTGIPAHGFRVLEYAYADPGEPITAGQRSSDEKAPDEGSLGWLAAGAVGLLAWRKSRSRTARSN